MNKMRYELKQTMSNETFEVVVYKLAKEKYQVVLSEIKSYCADDLHAFEMDSVKRLRDAYKMQSEIFDYLIQNEFNKVTKRFADIS